MVNGMVYGVWEICYATQIGCMTKKDLFFGATCKGWLVTTVQSKTS